ncbi:hypothetical protein L1887_23096 [Cichorium endivia]|nr:hypothetical protein L1887_23096 [Cichorium endivia]
MIRRKISNGAGEKGIGKRKGCQTFVVQATPPIVEVKAVVLGLWLRYGAGEEVRQWWQRCFVVIGSGGVMETDVIREKINGRGSLAGIDRGIEAYGEPGNDDRMGMKGREREGRELYIQFVIKFIQYSYTQLRKTSVNHSNSENPLDFLLFYL